VIPVFLLLARNLHLPEINEVSRSQTFGVSAVGGGMSAEKKREVELLLKFGLLLLLLALPAQGLSGARQGADGRQVQSQDADARADFVALMERAESLLIRVPLNRSGEENTDLAELRAVADPLAPRHPAALNHLWEGGVTITPLIGSMQTGWSEWQGQGWARPGYYAYYRPYFAAGGLAWHYGDPVRTIVADADGLTWTYYSYARTYYW